MSKPGPPSYSNYENSVEFNDDVLETPTTPHNSNIRGGGIDDQPEPDLDIVYDNAAAVAAVSGAVAAPTDDNIEADLSDDDDAHQKEGEISTELVFATDDDEDDDPENQSFLNKMQFNLLRNKLIAEHPECIIHNMHEIQARCKITRDADGVVVDDLHVTSSWVTNFEKTGAISMRAAQINNGNPAYVKVPEGLFDSGIIAEMEFNQKRIPFIVARHGVNNTTEYWHLRDLDIIGY